MTRDNPGLDAAVTVSAVISRIEMPAVALAALEPCDILNTEPEVGQQPILRLTVGASTIALASIAKVEGKLVATIIENRPELSERKGDTWKVRKPKPPTD